MLIGFIAAFLFVVAAAPIWSYAIHLNSNQVAQILTTEQSNNILPECEEHHTETDSETWEPIIQGHALKIEKIYQTTSLAKVRAMAFVYVDQKQGREMISSVNKLTHGLESKWRTTLNEPYPLAIIDKQYQDTIDKLELRSADSGLSLRRWYSINGTITNSPTMAKLFELRNQLLLKSNISVHYILTTDSDNLQADSALDEVVKIILEPNVD